jgi:hypothetical protein
VGLSMADDGRDSEVMLNRRLESEDYTVSTLQQFGQFAVPFLKGLDP